jgi:uncharacterized protein (DUF2235 family)
METLTQPGSKANLALWYVGISLFALVFAWPNLSNADENEDEGDVHSITQASESISNNVPKSIFVFLDGTRNDSHSGTNVWQLYQLIYKNNDSQTTSIYIEGVGSVDNPILGSVLGHGMKKRILKGYEFVAQNYSPGDDLYIFGFSRGAHEARSLAGLLAYAGVPKLSDENRDPLLTIGDGVLGLTKETTDTDYNDRWRSWKPGEAPLLAAEIKDKLQQEMQPVEIKFLGVWDTVPGSAFKKYQDCIEKIGFFKRWFHWLPMISEGERYKSGSYPAIHQIAHAVSLDEKRSKFASLLACEAINPQFTKVTEVWFPGAHADVGGGYEDSNELPGISLNWMIEILSRSYKFNGPPPQVEANPQGLAHWSIGDSPANWRSDCEDRILPMGAEVHRSFEVRKNSGPVPVRVDGKVVPLPYPKMCSDR